jgi:hypothetical protein
MSLLPACCSPPPICYLANEAKPRTHRTGRHEFWRDDERHIAKCNIPKFSNKEENEFPFPKNENQQKLFLHMVLCIVLLHNSCAFAMIVVICLSNVPKNLNLTFFSPSKVKQNKKKLTKKGTYVSLGLFLQIIN